ncbi:AhpC/TSA family protein [Alteribacter populi]|uniref:AhpC/TSA family protein n=1 Tax=Alteribacter populi TaxID=2011011 RepID=UPI000BBAE697
MRKRVVEIERQDYKIVVVAPSKATFVKQFVDAFGPYPFPIYGDPSRQAYQGLGHQTPPKLKVLGIAAFGFLTGKVKNFIPKEEKKKKVVMHSMKTQDVYIQGGTWLFDEKGNLLWNHIDGSPYDHAQLDQVIEEMKMNK